MESSIFKYIRRYSLRQQIWIVIVSGVSFPFLYLFYELPKRIVNDAILSDPERFPVEFLGLELGHFAFLFALCGLFLILVMINQAFKYYINLFKGLTGERMLRRLRFDLYSRVLRFPLPTFRNMSQGEIIPMITAEVEPLGGFIGDAYAQPAFQGGQLLVIITFLFVANPIMAGAAVALYPLQVYVIPKLQRRVNLLGKERVRLVRKLSDRIGESVQGVQEVHVHDTSRLERADFSIRLGEIFEVRYKIYRQKFVIKFINNFIQQLGPFFFYSLGGYLVISESLDIGTLLAAIAAHKDLAAPWKQLLNYYQTSADSRIKYDQVVSQFEPPGMRDESSQDTEPEQVTPLTGDVATFNLTLNDDQDVPVVDGVNLKFGLDQRVAIVGAGGPGRDNLMLLLARILDPHGGRVTVGGQDSIALPEAITGRRMSFVGSAGYVFAATLANNLYYGLKHRQIGPNPDDKAAAAHKERTAESLRAGNSADDIQGDWLDLAGSGLASTAELDQQALRVLDLVELRDDVYRFGLRGTIDPHKEPERAEAIMKAREALRVRAKADSGIAALIETFDRTKYNTNATMAENLLFGNSVGDVFKMDRLAENDYVLSVLKKADLTDTILQAGFQVAATMIELFADLPPDHEIFQQFSFISAEDLSEFQALLSRADKDHPETLSSEDRSKLLSLPFLIIPARHRLGLITDDLQAQILKAREIFAADLPDDLRAAVEFYEHDRYISAANIQDNILFGKISHGEAHAADNVGQLISDVIRDLGLSDEIVRVGLGYHVGVGGARLTPGQRQKLVLARSLIKQPDLLLISEGLNALDAAAQTRIMNNLLEEYHGRALVWSLQRPELAESFDRVIVMEGGKVKEQGTFAELKGAGNALAGLVAERVA